MAIRNILIISQPVGNRGDESAHRALVRSLNNALPDTHVVILAFQDVLNAMDEFVVKDERNTYVNFLFPHNWGAGPYALFLIKRGLTARGVSLHPILRRIKPYYQKADVVICAPGGICMGGFQNWKHMFLLQVARDMNKPTVYYSRSIGPFPEETSLNRRFKALSLDMLSSFSFLSLRDSKSKKLADALNIKYVSSIDTAFLDHPRMVVPENIARQLMDKYVVFVPNELTWHFAYRAIPQATIDNFYLSAFKEIRMAYPDHQVVMLPQLCSLKQKDDYTYFKRLSFMAEDADIYVLPDTYSSDLQQTIISKASLVVGARYHTIVFSVNNEVPFIAFGYEHKIPGMLEELSLSDHVVDITNAFDSEATITETLNLFAEKIQSLSTQQPSRNYAASMAKECFDKMITTIQSLN